MLKGLIVSTPEVRGLLDGTGMVVRRKMKTQPESEWLYDAEEEWTGYIGPANEQPIIFDGKAYWNYGAHWGSQPRLDAPFPICPFPVGTEIWLRETWAGSGNHDGHPVDAAGRLCKWADAEIFYLADCTPAPYGLARLPNGRGDFAGPWRSPATMPLLFARPERWIVTRNAAMQDGGVWAWEHWMERKEGK